MSASMKILAMASVRGMNYILKYTTKLQNVIENSLNAASIRKKYGTLVPFPGKCQQDTWHWRNHSRKTRYTAWTQWVEVLTRSSDKRIVAIKLAAVMCVAYFDTSTMARVRRKWQEQRKQKLYAGDAYKCGTWKHQGTSQQMSISLMRRPEKK